MARLGCEGLASGLHCGSHVDLPRTEILPAAPSPRWSPSPRVRLTRDVLSASGSWISASLSRVLFLSLLRIRKRIRSSSSLRLRHCIPPELAGRPVSSYRSPRRRRCGGARAVRGARHGRRDQFWKWTRSRLGRWRIRNIWPGCGRRTYPVDRQLIVSLRFFGSSRRIVICFFRRFA